MTPYKYFEDREGVNDYQARCIFVLSQFYQFYHKKKR